MEKRAIKNRVLNILSALESEEIIILAKKQYEESLTMTDKMAALIILEDISKEESNEALKHFLWHL